MIRHSHANESPGERADRTRNASRMLALTAAVLVFVGMSITIVVLAVRQDHSQSVLKLLQCHLIAGQPCYNKDRSAQNKVLSQLDQVILASLICHDRHSKFTSAQLQPCVVSEVRK